MVEDDFERGLMIQKNIQVTPKQDEFIRSQKQTFNFSKFVRVQIDDYMNYKKEVNLNEK